MRKRSISARGILLSILWAVLALGLLYHMAFYRPLQRELEKLAADEALLDSQILAAASRVNAMDTMDQELEEILARSAEEVTEIAPYDNKQAVLSELSGILAQTQDYSLSFTDPEISADGMVRRKVSMSFRCADYAAAKAVIRDLTDSRWRCLVGNLSITGDDGDVFGDTVSVTATITFFEHTGLN